MFTSTISIPSFGLRICLQQKRILNLKQNLNLNYNLEVIRVEAEEDWIDNQENLSQEIRIEFEENWIQIMKIVL